MARNQTKPKLVNETEVQCSANMAPICTSMNLIRGAGRLTRKQNADSLEIDMLATVFDKRLAKHLDKPISPFRVSPETLFVPSQGLTSSDL